MRRAVLGACWPHGLLPLVLLALTLNCRGQRTHTPTDSGGAEPAASSLAPASSVQVPSLAQGPPSRPSPLAGDPLWNQAAAGDSVDLRRLANRDGAAGLLIGLEAGGTLARTAVAALPYAPDGELGLRRLCELLLHLREPTELELVLGAVHALVARPPPQAERLDLTGYRECVAPLDALRARPTMPAAARDLAASARSLLVEHGVRQ